MVNYIEIEIENINRKPTTQNIQESVKNHNPPVDNQKSTFNERQECLFNRRRRPHLTKLTSLLLSFHLMLKPLPLLLQPSYLVIPDFIDLQRTVTTSKPDWDGSFFSLWRLYKNSVQCSSVVGGEESFVCPGRGRWGKWGSAERRWPRSRLVKLMVCHCWLWRLLLLPRRFF